jgi:hypothetical protein
LQKINIMAITGILVLATTSAFAASPCQTPTGGASWTGYGVAANYTALGGGCNVTITFGAGGLITSATTNAAGYYDSGLDDNLIGIINNSGGVINSITLTSSSTDIFGFDGDGICSGFTFAVAQSTVCSAASEASGNEDNYAPIGVSFSGINGAATTGTVNFAGGIANGATAFFSLEGPADLTHLGVVPEPTSIVLLGTLLLGAAAGLRRRVKN